MQKVNGVDQGLRILIMQLLVVDLVVPCDQAGGFEAAATYDIRLWVVEAVRLVAWFIFDWSFPFVFCISHQGHTLIALEVDIEKDSCIVLLTKYSQHS